jgi:ribosomal protein S18 acetylase RimI-like enzyme
MICYRILKPIQSESYAPKIPEPENSNWHQIFMAMKVTIRKAKPRDAAALGRIQVTSWRSAFRNIASDDYLDHYVREENQAEDWREILADAEQVVCVAEMDNQPVGYGWAHREDDESIGWDAELISMHILPEYKRQGIGRKLFAAIATELKAQGCKSVYLWVLEDNHPSRKFYEALGGQSAGKHLIALGDRKLTEVAYGWKDISQLEITE